MQTTRMLSLCGLLWSAAAWAGPADEAAHQRYAERLDRIEAPAAAAAEPVPLERLGGVPAGAPEPAADPAAQLAELLEASWNWEMRITPEIATFTGYPGQNDRWSDLSPENIARVEALQARSLALAEALSREPLTAEERLNLDLFLYLRRQEVAGHRFPEEWLLVNQMYGVHTMIPQALGAMPLFNRDQVEDYLARLQAVPTLLAQTIAMLERGRENGVTPPQVAMRKVPPQVRGLAPRKALASPLLKPLRSIEPELAQRTGVQQRALALYGERVQPAFERLARYLEEDYLPDAREATAFTTVPDGQDWYAWNIRKTTTTDLTAQEIHDIGLAEVERIRGEMHEIMRELDFDGDIPEFVAQLSEDSSHFYASEEALLRDYRVKAKLADGALPKLFRRFAALPYRVEPVPAHEAAGKPGAYYLPGSAENGRPGTFFVNTSRLDETPKFETEALLLHEAVPGHHFQIALAQEFEGLPDFRKFARFTAYTEGWGLYAESLGPEMGFYSDPYSRFGALTFEIWRAVRLVVDTGLHALGWSRQEAIDYFHANTGRGPQRIEAEIDRYLVLPGQALAYKIGQLRIQALRERAREQLGEDFDLRAFHDQVLGAGALPLDMLQARIERWIDQAGEAQ